MKWSWRIGRIVGIDIRVHVTFPLLFVWVAMVALGEGASTASVVAAIALMLAVFAIVVLHECGHALAARHFGIATRDITLLPIGGIARMERIPREPRQELLIALAGPAVNVALAALLAVVLSAIGGERALAGVAQEPASVTPASVVAQLLAINIWLAAFNLLPAFPMDGGRVLRAVLALRSRDYGRATAAAARLGRMFAVLFGLVGLLVLDSPVLIIIAAFIWAAASTEAATVQMSVALADVTLANVMATDVSTLSPADPLSRAADLTIEGFQQDFPVVENGALVGMLTRGDLLRGLTEHGITAPVRLAMRRDFPTASLDDPPEAAVRGLALARATMLPVVRDRRLVGVLTAENVSEFLTLRAARGPLAESGTPNA